MIRIKTSTHGLTSGLAIMLLPIDTVEPLIRKLGWLQPLTEEAIIEAIKSCLPEGSTREGIENYLRTRLIDIEGLVELLSKMVKKGKLE